MHEIFFDISALSKLNMLKLVNTIWPFTDFIYILQLEEYSSKRLIRWMPKFFFRRNFQIRQKLLFTKRVKIIFAVAVLLYLLDILFTTVLLGVNVLTFLLFFFQTLMIPIYTLLSNVLTSFCFEWIKSKQRKKAQNYISQLPNLKVIVIAGSFGKTTTKNFLFQLLRYSHQTQMIPGNINTPAGIANWVLQHLENTCEVLIAEVDAYETGEIRKSCEILNPDFSIITNIGDQHLERFGSEMNLAKAIFETFECTKTTGIRLTNESTLAKISHYKINHNNFEILKVEEFEGKFSNEVNIAISEARKNLSDSNKVNLDFALGIVDKLGYTERFLCDALQSLELPDRRQKLGNLFGFEAIDDSYNISFTTALAGLARAFDLKKQKDKKLLVITAGIPELGKENKDKNFLLGSEISKVCDFCIILESDFAVDLSKGFGDIKNFKVEKNLNQTIINGLQNFNKDEWLLLLQPELGDLYY